MNDSKNFLLAFFSSIYPVLAAIETQTIIRIISAVVLPVLFFCVGKTIDVLLQIHFRRQEAKRRELSNGLTDNKENNEKN